MSISLLWHTFADVVWRVYAQERSPPAQGQSLASVAAAAETLLLLLRRLDGMTMTAMHRRRRRPWCAKTSYTVAAGHHSHSKHQSRPRVCPKGAMLSSGYLRDRRTDPLRVVSNLQIVNVLTFVFLFSTNIYS